MQRLFWITGLAGSGKSTCASYLAKKLKEKYDNVIVIDGDAIREICSHDLGYNPEDRRKNAFRVAKLCEYLCNQGMIVICATISLYRETHEYIYEHFMSPQIIYLDIPRNIVQARDQKSLYSEGKCVVGKDIEFDEPNHINFVKKITDPSKVFRIIDEIAEKI
jgi:adenylylsulfate kinase-like enzyme